MRETELYLDKHATGAEQRVDQSLTMLSPPGIRADLNVQHASYFPKGDRINMMTSQYENSLFSSSLSELFSRRMRLTSNEAVYGHSVDTVTSRGEEEPFESLEEMEAQTIGNLLPDDDDLLSGMTNDYNVNLNGGNYLDELDLFSSVGGMDLGNEGSSDVQRTPEFPRASPSDLLGVCNGSEAGKHGYGLKPSRTLAVRNINSNVEDSAIRAIFEQYGDIHTLYTVYRNHGFVMISYYDIRAAQNAMQALQSKPLRDKKLDIHYSDPKDNISCTDVNQATLNVVLLDSSVSNDELHRKFGVFGEIKEISDIPHNSNHKFIEYYDVRDAVAALQALNRGDTAGKHIKVEPGHPQCMGQPISLKSEHNQYGCVVQQNLPTNNPGDVARWKSMSGVVDGVTILSSPAAVQGPFVNHTLNHGISSSITNRFPSRVGIESVANQSGHFSSHSNFDTRGSPTFHHHSLPEYHDGLTNVHRKTPSLMVENVISRSSEILDNNRQPVELSEVFGSAGTGSYHLLGNQFASSNQYNANHGGMMWSSTPSIVNGIGTARSPVQLHGFLKAPSHLMNIMPRGNHHVGSAPTFDQSLWDFPHPYAGESPKASGLHSHSLRSMGTSNSSLQSMDFVSHNIFPHGGGNCMNMPIPTKNNGVRSQHQRSAMYPGRTRMSPMMNLTDHRNEHTRSYRSEGSINQADKKQYELDLDRILRGEDKRTTLMIKNIPNKYTSKMLLAAIDESHRGTYDFIYLPIDFKNKCNVGYAFINMVDPSLIVQFYQAFNGMKWEKFNSEKVASLAYARIQGKSSLVAHFQNSSLMNEDKRCRPILFNSEGPNAGDQVPFPMGVNVRTRSTRSRAISSEENQEESPRNLATEDDFSN